MKTETYLTGQPKTLTVLDFGLFKVHANGRVIGICGFLVRTNAGENVLIDTGFPQKYAENTEAASEADKLGDFGEVLELTKQHLPEAQLALAGLRSQDIDLLIMTHTHIDHVGGIGDFPDRSILMSGAERALDRPLYWGKIQPIEWPDRKYLLINEDTQIGPGFRILHVPGHAPGQLALELELPETGTVLITSDAVSRPAEIDEGFAGSWDVEQAVASGARLMCRAEKSEAFVIYGHSPEQWPKLRKAPDYYG